MSGNNFTATSLGGDTGNFQLQNSCAPCVAGQTLGVGGSFIGSQIGGGGTATINGMSFSGPGYQGQIHLGGNQFVVPSVLTNVTITVPFTFSATLSGCPNGSCLINPVIFTVDLVGSGTATALLISTGLIRWEGPYSSFQRRPSNSRKFLNLRRYCYLEAGLPSLRQNSDADFPPTKMVLCEALDLRG